eukprot:TRINITY_DN17636_c0_g5_i1.p1 TRINITY_DN17636_c0_g5~~TRINITY_DN17636_c0_g5_i1.p1  ORF type:complete len:503 (-),score=51.11 TRINITY_DN17636_c0_g5_i1:68-1576(-)
MAPASPDVADGAARAAGSTTACGEKTPLLRAGGSDARVGGVAAAAAVVAGGEEKAAAYTVLTELATTPTLLFSSFHMLMFLKVHGLSATQVASAQVVLCIWNSTNVLLAGRLATRYAARWGSHLWLLCLVQLLWDLTTCLPFLELPQYFMQSSGGTLYYLSCLCLYDAFLNLAGVARPALLAELTDGEEERVHFRRWSSVLGNVEGLVPLVGYATWRESAPGAFRAFLAATLASALVFNVLSAARLAPHLREGAKQRAAVGDTAAAGEASPPASVFLSCLPAEVWVYVAVFSLHELQGAALPARRRAHRALHRERPRLLPHHLGRLKARGVRRHSLDLPRQSGAHAGGRRVGILYGSRACRRAGPAFGRSDNHGSPVLLWRCCRGEPRGRLHAAAAHGRLPAPACGLLANVRLRLARQLLLLLHQAVGFPRHRPGSRSARRGCGPAAAGGAGEVLRYPRRSAARRWRCPVFLVGTLFPEHPWPRCRRFWRRRRCRRRRLMGG